jgi:hypothetical protein
MAKTHLQLGSGRGAVGITINFNLMVLYQMTLAPDKVAKKLIPFIG